MSGLIGQMMSEYDRLLATTPVGMTFPWKGAYRLVHITECGRRYVTEVTVPIAA